MLGDSDAEYETGFCLMAGVGVVHDDLMAIHWAHQAAKHGNEKAMCFMGVFYAEGWSDWLKIDYVEAYKFFKIAAKRGNENATNWLTTIVAKMTDEEILEGECRSREFELKNSSINSLGVV